MNDAELAVIGCLIQTQAQGEILEEVAPEDFSERGWETVPRSSLSLRCRMI